MYQQRRDLYARLENSRGSKVLVYVTGTRQNLETQIHPEILDFFADHLDSMFNGGCKKVSLILHSNGGVTLAGWALVNLIRMFCDEFEVIIPSKALSTGTLIAIGADKIVMTKQATLGPIDPSTNGPYNPQYPIDGSGQTLPLSVESVAGYFDLAKELVKDGADLHSVFSMLSSKVHPIALGNVQRARSQIKMLAKRLLSYHMDDDQKIEKITSFLCSESGSHDYTINRREAQNLLNLPIEKPSPELYELIKEIYKDFSTEMLFNEPLLPQTMLAGGDNAPYRFVRGLIESRGGGSNQFIHEGFYQKITVQQNFNGVLVPADNIQDVMTFQGWKYENP